MSEMHDEGQEVEGHGRITKLDEDATDDVEGHGRITK
jgi:hypothetical protein